MTADTQALHYAIQEYLETVTRIRRECSESYLRRNPKIKYAGCEEFVLKEGSSMLPTPVRHGYRKMRNKECFKNSTNGVTWLGLDYVEGFFIRQSLPIAIHHAWNLDNNGHVVDLTTGWEPDSFYFGVRFEASFLARQIIRNGFYGLLAGSCTSTDLAMGLDPDFPYAWKRDTHPSTLEGDSHADKGTT